MLLLILGLVLFLGVHSTSIVAEGWRDGMVQRIGEGPWKGLYSLVSLVGFGLLVAGYAAARTRPTLVFVPPMALSHLTLLLMVPVFPLLMATYLPGRISAMARHPFLVATKLWALAHLLANGMLHDLVLFGAFLAWAVVDRISLRRRTERAIPRAPQGKANDVIAVVVGLAMYVAFLLWAHQWLVGVAPIG